MAEDNLHEMQGPALLLAAPGTGKTHRLGRRIKYLVEERQVSPEAITVITFTAAAARNMRAAISDDGKKDLFLPFSSQPKLICTMHSLGYRIIRDTIADSESLRVIGDDQLRSVLLEDAAQLAGFSRSDGAATADCRQSGLCRPNADHKCTICRKYRAILKCCCAIDYDEQILLACDLIRENGELRQKYRASARHLLVDEYQDINAAQFELISTLSEEQRDGLFVVGDDDQSIYSWRGGSPAFIRKFKEDFGPKAKVEPLTKSFRCHRHVLEGAIAVVQKHDTGRLQKGAFEYSRKDGRKIQIHSVPSDLKEAIIVRKIIESALPRQSVLVLVPQIQYSTAIKAELRRAQIQFSEPVNPPGDGLPLIAYAAAWLKDPNDSLPLRRCLEAYMASCRSGVPSARARLPEKQRQRDAALGEISELWDDLLTGTSASLWAALESKRTMGSLLMSVHDTFSTLAKSYHDDGDLAVFVADLVRELQPWRKIAGFLGEICTWVDNASQSRTSGPRDDVRLMSLQGAKGLQADVVCVLGVEEGTLPRSDAVGEWLAEQSRLFFVSMTRAVNELHLFHARTRSGAVVHRNLYRGSGPPDIRGSRFLNELPNVNCERVFHKA